VTSATPGKGARNGAVVGRIPPIPLRPSRLAFNRLGSSSLCVGDHYCSLRRQVSPLYYYSHKFNPILV
jgi:hypothetical protein